MAEISKRLKAIITDKRAESGGVQTNAEAVTVGKDASS